MSKTTVRLSYVMLFLFVIQTTLTEALENIVVMEGSEGSFKCPSTSGNCNGVDWRKYSPSMIKISRGNNILSTVDKSRYSLNVSDGCNLHIKGVQLEDAARYDCEYIDNKNAVQKSAFLIVLKSPPTCTARVNASGGEEAEGDGVQLTCDLTFRGIEKASMTWRDLRDVSVPERSDDNLRLSHSLIASRPNIPSYECVTTFEIPEGIIGLAGNIPVAPTCATKEFKLKYPVKTVSLSPSLSVYSPGTVITCSSDGNPSPSYKWQITEAIKDGKSENWKDISGETEREITVENATSNYYRCVASNTVRGSSFVAFSEPFQVNYARNSALSSAEKSGSLVGIAVGVTAGILVLLVIISAVIIYFRVCRKKGSMNTKEDGDQRQYMNMETATGRRTQAPSAAQGTTTGEGEETAYASLGNGRGDEHCYASLGARPK